MTRLAYTVQELGLDAEVSPSGRWLRFRGEQRTVYVLKALWGDDYYLWCEPPAAPATQLYRDPLEALEAGLRCAGAGSTGRIAARGQQTCHG